MKEVWERARDEANKRLSPESVLGAYFVPLILLKWRFFLVLSTSVSEKFTLEDKLQAANNFLWGHGWDYVFALMAAAFYLCVWPEAQHKIDMFLLNRKRIKETERAEFLKTGLMQIEPFFQVLGNLDQLKAQSIPHESLAEYIKWTQSRFTSSGAKGEIMEVFNGLNDLNNRVRQLDTLITGGEHLGVSYKEEITRILQRHRSKK